MLLRLRRGGAYLADLNVLRRRAAANGLLPTVLPLAICHPAAPESFQVYLNLAYEADPQRPPPPASLCLLGLRNGHGAWHFRVPGIDSLPDARFPNGSAGSYARLGYLDELPALSDLALGQDVASLAAYAGRPLDQALRDSLARTIVVVSEAMRFDSVAAGVNAVLVREGSFRPRLATLRAWDGHGLGLQAGPR